MKKKITSKCLVSVPCSVGVVVMSLSAPKKNNRCVLRRLLLVCSVHGVESESSTCDVRVLFTRYTSK